MGFIKRIFLFMAVNFLVVATISILLQVLGVRPYINAYGLDFEALAVFCLVWGMAGSFISLALSRLMAKWMMGVKVIDPNTSQYELSELVQTVHHQARAAGISVMPEVGIFESPEVNAFATGPTRNRALVAVSTGLLSRMSKSEIEGVLGHEVSHIANGDMVTMTLIQGIVNAFVMFLSRAIAWGINQALRNRDNEGEGLGRFSYFIVQFLLEIVFMILGMIVVSWFSRQREYRADQGGARLAGREKMISALQRLKQNYEIVNPETSPSMQALQISGHPRGFAALFSTHPSLDDRIERLKHMA